MTTYKDRLGRNSSTANEIGTETRDLDAMHAAAKAEGGRVIVLDWTFLSPSAMFMPGKRTGKFRLGKDALLSNQSGSSISFEDYAIALVDEIERPAHLRQRFTVGYQSSQPSSVFQD